MIKLTESDIYPPRLPNKIKGHTMKKLTITIDEKSLAELKRQAREENRNVSQHIRELVKEQRKKMSVKDRIALYKAKGLNPATKNLKSE